MADYDDSARPRNEKGQYLPGTPGPGRKKLSEIVAETLSDEDWLNLFRKAKKRALNCKDPKSDKYFEILLERAFGKVPQDSNVNMSGSINVESVVQVLEDLRNKQGDQP